MRQVQQRLRDALDGFMAHLVEQQREDNRHREAQREIEHSAKQRGKG